MANPVVIEIPEGQWIKVAENVTLGTINRLTSDVNYYQTYRVTGQPSPTNPTAGEIPLEAVKMFESGNSEEIGSPTNIDVYILSSDNHLSTSKVGKVRVDI